MRWFTAQVIDCQDLGADYSLLVLGGCAALEDARPGQFVMLRGNWGRDPILPRPYSILDVDHEEARFLVRRVGRGSRLITAALPGEEITVLGPLGTSFPDPPEAGNEIDLLVAGGCGLPPLYRVAAAAQRSGRGDRVELLYGAKSGEELVLLDRIAGWDLRVETITEDGSGPGEKGLVTDLLVRRLEARRQRCRVMACGPVAMLESVREVARRNGVRCLLSLEAHMACGLGACLGCAVEGKQTPYLHVCSDGPVFDAEVVWPASSDAP
jgi:dihydroorotate dehydrogenase electron transfer subunit